MRATGKQWRFDGHLKKRGYNHCKIMRTMLLVLQDCTESLTKAVDLTTIKVCKYFLIHSCIAATHYIIGIYLLLILQPLFSIYFPLSNNFFHSVGVLCTFPIVDKNSWKLNWNGRKKNWLPDSMKKRVWILWLSRNSNSGSDSIARC